MTYEASTTRGFAVYGERKRRRTVVSQPVLCGIALILSASVGLFWLYSGPADDAAPVAQLGVATPLPLKPLTLAAPVRMALKARLEAYRLAASRNVYGGLIDPGFTADDRPSTFSQNMPLGSALAQLRGSSADAGAPPSPVPGGAPQVAELQIVPPATIDVGAAPDVPMPPRRPGSLPAPDAAGPSSGADVAPHATNEPAPTAAPAARPSFFDRLFGRQTPPTSALGYAPEDGGLGNVFSPRQPTEDGRTAIYDISAHTVYLPDGTRLEAHSGLGGMIDDPRSVAARMHGATPPNVYELGLREQPFHGVRALRLTPVGNGDTYGRGGLLAHTYMLGPRGDSNGCVVFKNYQAFLAAFEAGQVKRLLVVARVD